MPKHGPWETVYRRMHDLTRPGMATVINQHYDPRNYGVTNCPINHSQMGGGAGQRPPVTQPETAGKTSARLDSPRLCGPHFRRRRRGESRPPGRRLWIRKASRAADAGPSVGESWPH